MEPITALYCEYGKKPREITIIPTLEKLQELVGGYIEILRLPTRKPMNIILNEEGKMIYSDPVLGLLHPHTINVVDEIYGPCLVVGDITTENDEDIIQSYSNSCDKALSEIVVFYHV